MVKTDSGQKRRLVKNGWRSKKFVVKMATVNDNGEKLDEMGPGRNSGQSDSGQNDRG